MRDFLYNKSDVLIAILIILVAAGVIFWRVGVILEFPEGVKTGTEKFVALVLPFIDDGDAEDDDFEVPKADLGSGASEGITGADAGASADAGAGGQQDVAPADSEASGADAAQEPADGGGVTSGEVVEGGGGEAAAEGDGEAADGGEGAEEAPAATGEVVKFTVHSGDVASVVADNLLAAGLISNKQEFLARVDERNAAMSMLAGDFEIAKGSTHDQIIDKLIGKA